MCGFAGFLAAGGLGARDVREVAMKMGDAIAHRGPDDAGVWNDIDAQIALVHRRLSILDLSPAGHQPMICNAGRYVIVLNGEIYNHLELRKLLEKIGAIQGWRGHSDTETLLACFSTWGVKESIERCVGMFAFALWDRQERILTLGRDRLGEKPLYYGWQGRGSNASFLFASELSAFKAHPAFISEVNRDALASMMRHNYISAPSSIYRDVNKLNPGCLLRVSIEQPEPEIQVYWSFADMVSSRKQQPFSGSAEQAVDELEDLLKLAVRQQMLSDVPLGAFLSGGVDSSTVVALMQEQSARPVQTFTIGFNEKDYNEAEHAKAVASYLGTDHTELYVEPKDVLSVIPKIPTLYSEPFSDSSQIPTFLVSQLARRKVTVSLSGDAGDELFCGYTRYQMTSRFLSKVSKAPWPLRKFIADLISVLPPSLYNKLGGVLNMPGVGEKLHKGATLLNCLSVKDFYRAIVSHWRDPESLVLGATEAPTIFSRQLPELDVLGDIERMMALDTLSYLPDDILAKVDRAAMAVGLETRVPFLDHRVVEFAWSLPIDYKLRNGVTKWPLRQIVNRYVPAELIDRPKMGFGVPIDQWLRGPLRDWAESLLDESRLQSEGFFNPSPIRRKWSEHLSGQGNWQYHLWDVLMFQAWLEAQKK